jgi:hypothetical protein
MGGEEVDTFPSPPTMCGEGDDIRRQLLGGWLTDQRRWGVGKVFLHEKRPPAWF